LVAWTSFLLETARTHEGIHICQRKYALNILVGIWMLNAKLALTHDKNIDNLFDQNLDTYEASSYQRTIARLLHLVNTRPNIYVSLYSSLASSFKLLPPLSSGATHS